jgi:hypothetical protein
MNMKVLVFLFFLLLLIVPYYMHGQACDPPRPPSLGSPGNDHGDERFSFANKEFGDLFTCSINPDVIILKSGYYKEALSLISKFTDNIGIFEGKEIYLGNSDAMPVLFIPSGGLFGKQHDTAFKLIIAEYIRLLGLDKSSREASIIHNIVAFFLDEMKK